MPTYQRREHSDGEGQHRNTGAEAASARGQVDAFFDWAGMHDSRTRARWEGHVTHLVRGGMSADNAAKVAKDKWFEHRRRNNLAPRIDQTRDDVGTAMFDAVMAVLYSGLTPREAAVAFRGVERDFPGEEAPRRTALHCERLGDDWRNAEQGGVPVEGSWL